MPTRNPCVVGAMHVSSGACTGRYILFLYATRPLLAIKQLVRTDLVGPRPTPCWRSLQSMALPTLRHSGASSSAREKMLSILQRSSIIHPYSIHEKLTDTDVSRPPQQYSAGGADDSIFWAASKYTRLARRRVLLPSKQASVSRADLWVLILLGCCFWCVAYP